MLHSVSAWQSLLREGRLDDALRRLCGRESVAAERVRYSALLDRFLAQFGPRPQAALVSAPGRTEIGGNHTDHQRGRVLAAAVTLDCIACAAPNGENCIRIQSEGYAPVRVSLDSLAPVPSETGTPAALVRGMAAEELKGLSEGLERRTAELFAPEPQMTVEQDAAREQNSAFLI